MKASRWNRWWMAAVFAGAGVMLASAAKAQEETPASPDVNRIIEELGKIGPDQLAARIAEMRAEAEAKVVEAAKMREDAAALVTKADEVDAHAKALMENLARLEAHAKALAALFGASTPEAAMTAEAVPMDAAPAPPADAASEMVTVNFAEHIQPIFKARCMSCHNEDKKRGGLSLESYAAALAGGSSGAVVVAGQPDASRLLKLVSKLEEPFMPPSGDPLTEEQLAQIREWIQQGAGADGTAKKMAASEASAATETAFVAATFSDGPPPMPEVSLAAPVHGSERGIVARAMATSPRAKLMAVGGHREILLYDLESYRVIGALPFPEGEVYTLTFSLNGEVLLAGGGEVGKSGLTVVWNVRKAERIGTYGEGYDTVLAADMSPDHTMVAVGGPSKSVRVFSARGGALLYKLDSHTDWIFAIRFSPDGELLATADRAGGLSLWQAANGRPVESLRGHNGAIHDLAYSDDSTLLASAGQDGTVQIWDTWKYAKVRQFTAHPSGVLSVDFAGNGELVTSGADQRTVRWDAAGKALTTYEPLPDWGYQARFAESDRLVLAGTWTGDVFVWEAASGQRVAALSTHP